MFADERGQIAKGRSLLRMDGAQRKKHWVVWATYWNLWFGGYLRVDQDQYADQYIRLQCLCSGREIYDPPELTVVLKAANGVRIGYFW